VRWYRSVYRSIISFLLYKRFIGVQGAKDVGLTQMKFIAIAIKIIRGRVHSTFSFLKTKRICSCMHHCLHITFISSVIDSSPKPRFQRYFKMSSQTTMGTWPLIWHLWWAMRTPDFIQTMHYIKPSHHPN
jgi:hypothetical protein